MVELAYTSALEADSRKGLEVQVLSPAPRKNGSLLTFLREPRGKLLAIFFTWPRGYKAAVHVAGHNGYFSMELAIQIIGWTGTALIVLAHLLVSFEKVEGDNKIYQAMNLFGAIGVGINVFHERAWPAVALQGVWGIIAIVDLVKKK